MEKIRRLLATTLVFMLLLIMGVSGVIPSTTAEAKTTTMKVYFLDVGQADSILIQSDGRSMLIDAGNNKDGSTVVAFLKKHGVTKLDYVIGTHPHADHIGGMDDVIDSFTISKVILPKKETTTRTFEDVLDAISNKNLKITKPTVGNTYSIGDAKFTIVAPNGSYGSSLNNWSVGIRLVNGSTSFLMCGDAEKKAESDILANGLKMKADVLKTGHHGSSTSTTTAFLKAVDPNYAVISCGTGNTYGHPSKQTITRLRNAGVKIYRTDSQGTVIATSNGKKITWNKKPTTNFKSGNQTGSGTTTNTGTTTGKTVWVHITDTGTKYHLAGCRYLNSSDHKVTLKQAKEKGLTPCSVCKPPK